MKVREVFSPVSIIYYSFASLRFDGNAFRFPCKWHAFAVPMSVANSYVDLLDDTLRFRPREVNAQQTATQIRPQNLHPFCQQKSPLELPRRNAAMQVNPFTIIGLTARIINWRSSSVISS